MEKLDRNTNCWGVVFVCLSLSAWDAVSVGGWRGSGGRCLKEINILEVDCFFLFFNCCCLTEDVCYSQPLCIFLDLCRGADDVTVTGEQY